MSASLLQARVVSKNGTGAAGPYGLLNVTGSFSASVLLPGYLHSDGAPVYLGDVGDDSIGFPRNLYPNLTFTSTPVNRTFNISTAYFDGKQLYNNATLFLGPWLLNSSYALASITVPMNNNTSLSDTLGWLTVIVSCQSIFDVLDSYGGLGRTGQLLIFGPTTRDNKLPGSSEAGDLHITLDRSASRTIPVQFVLPPATNASRSQRHASVVYGRASPPFQMQKYPAVLDAFTNRNNVDRNAGSAISSNNEDGHKVSVGYALPGSSLVDWALVIEQSHTEVLAPITRLRNVLLACVFGTTGALLLLLLPLAHLSVRPIRRLREATKKTVEPYQYPSDGGSIRSSMSQEDEGDESSSEEGDDMTAVEAR